MRRTPKLTSAGVFVGAPHRAAVPCIDDVTYKLLRASPEAEAVRTRAIKWKETADGLAVKPARRGALAHLSRLCSHWGGKLLMLPKQEFNALNYQEPGISGAPDGWHAVNIPRRRVITAEGHACPGCVIHEMGHLFLIEAEPEICPDEWSWFGWEVVLARQAGCYQTWSKSTETYIMGGSCNDMEWGSLKPHEKQRLIADRIAHAKGIGIVSRDGEPLCTRNLK